MSGPGTTLLARLDDARVIADAELAAGNARARRIEQMVEHGTRRLNLLDWDIRFDPNQQPEKPEATSAEITFHDPAKSALLTVGSELDYQAAEIAVAHELLHAVLRPLTVQASRLLVHVKDDRARVHLNEMLDDAEEQVIETIARALVPGGPRVIATGERAELWAVFK